MNEIECQIKYCQPVCRDVYMVRLQTESPVQYEAGQYLELVIPGESWCYFSIANAPGSNLLELHIQLNGDESASARILEYLQTSQQVKIQLPMGETRLSALPVEDGPLLLLAAGTGFSQVKAIAEQLFMQSLTRPVHLYWSSRTVSGLYMADLAEKWHNSDHNFHFSAIVSEHNDWQDKQSLLQKAVIEDLPNLEQCQAVCCGSPEMVYATLDHLVEKGFRKDQMISDVFAYAPREDD